MEMEVAPDMAIAEALEIVLDLAKESYARSNTDPDRAFKDLEPERQNQFYAILAIEDLADDFSEDE